jgi:succinyl-diaminopimelate desuccinylase
MGFDLDSVERDIRARREESVAILRELVQTPSENPPGTTTEIAAQFTDRLDELGVNYEVVAPKAEMPNVVASFEGEVGDPDSGPHVVFNGHFDTFAVSERDDWEHDPFSGETVDGELWGRGASDMHAGFAASVVAFQYLYEHRDAFEGRVTFAATSDEETGSAWGAEYLLENHPEYRGDVVINGEPTSPELVAFGTRGVLWLDVSVRGVSGISAYPEGTNAIEELYGLVAALDSNHGDLVRIDAELRDIIEGSRETIDARFGDGATDHVLDLQTNIGVIEGGEKVNLYAEHANATVGVRLPITTSGEAVLDRVQELAAARAGEFDVSVISHTDPTFTSPDHPIVQAFLEEAAAVRGTPPDPYPGMAGTDVRFYREHGVPGASYGVTSINVGRPNERAPLEEFHDVAAVHARVAARYITSNRGGDR